MVGQNSRGSSLIQVLIAISLTGILGMVVASLFSQMNSLQTVAQARQDLLILNDEVKTLFANATACQGSLIAGTIYNVALASKPPPAPTVPLDGLPFRMMLASGTLASNLDITGYSLRGIKVLINGATLVGNIGASQVYLANLYGLFSPKNNKVGLKEFNHKLLVKGYFVVTGGNVTGCSLDNPISPAQTCEKLGGTWNPAINACETVPSVAKVCQIVGGTLNGNTCTLPVTTVAATAPPPPPPPGGTTGGGGRWFFVSDPITGLPTLPECPTVLAGSPCPTVGAKCNYTTMGPIEGSFAYGTMQCL